MGTLVACTGNLFSYRGATAQEKNRIALLEGGPFQGSWQTRDLAVKYNYLRDKKNLQISGTILLDSSLKTGFSTLEYLFFWVNFLGVDGNVLDTKGIMTSSHKKWILIENLFFKSRLEMPENTLAIAFSYRGRVRNGGGSTIAGDRLGEATDWEFWDVPKR